MIKYPDTPLVHVSILGQLNELSGVRVTENTDESVMMYNYNQLLETLCLNGVCIGDEESTALLKRYDANYIKFNIKSHRFTDPNKISHWNCVVHYNSLSKEIIFKVHIHLNQQQFTLKNNTNI